MKGPWLFLFFEQEGLMFYPPLLTCVMLLSRHGGASVACWSSTTQFSKYNKLASIPEGPCLSSPLPTTGQLTPGHAEAKSNLTRKSMLNASFLILFGNNQLSWEGHRFSQHPKSNWFIPKFMFLRSSLSKPLRCLCRDRLSCHIFKLYWHL